MSEVRRFALQQRSCVYLPASDSFSCLPNLCPAFTNPNLKTFFVAVQQEGDCCWICLDDASDEKPLQRMPCRCPRFAHAACVARWQLRSAGTRKETHCEFCDSELPSWKETLRLNYNFPVRPVMNVSFHGVSMCFEVQPGPEGYKKFVDEIVRAYSLPEGSEMNITFTCDEPMEPENRLMLRGEGAYDAAVTCAAISAARRLSSMTAQSNKPTLPPPKDSARLSPKLDFLGSVLGMISSLRCNTID